MRRGVTLLRRVIVPGSILWDGCVRRESWEAGPVDLGDPIHLRSLTGNLQPILFISAYHKIGDEFLLVLGL